MTEQRITISLLQRHLEYIGQLLGQRPYAEAAPIVQDLDRQLHEHQQREEAAAGQQPLRAVPPAA